MSSNIANTATPRFTFQSSPPGFPMERQMFSGFRVKKKKGALSVTGETLYAYFALNA